MSPLCSKKWGHSLNIREEGRRIGITGYSHDSGSPYRIMGSWIWNPVLFVRGWWTRWRAIARRGGQLAKDSSRPLQLPHRLELDSLGLPFYGIISEVNGRRDGGVLTVMMVVRRKERTRKWFEWSNTIRKSRPPHFLRCIILLFLIEWWKDKNTTKFIKNRERAFLKDLRLAAVKLDQTRVSIERNPFLSAPAECHFWEITCYMCGNKKCGIEWHERIKKRVCISECSLVAI